MYKVDLDNNVVYKTTNKKGLRLRKYKLINDKYVQVGYKNITLIELTKENCENFNELFNKIFQKSIGLLDK